MRCNGYQVDMPVLSSRPSRVVRGCLALVVTIASLFFCPLQNSGAANRIRLATLEWPPYVSQTLNHNGFISEIVAQAFARMGYTVETRFMPWERALRKLAEGKYDAAYPAYYSDARAMMYALSSPFSAGPIVFYKRRETLISYTTLVDLQPYTIGVVRGYVSTPEFDTADYLRKDIANSDEQNLTKLLKGRVDLIIIDQYTAQHLLTTRLPEARPHLDFLKPPLAEKLMHLMFSRRIAGYKQKWRDFERGLRQIQEDGTIRQIRKTHGLD